MNMVDLEAILALAAIAGIIAYLVWNWRLSDGKVSPPASVVSPSESPELVEIEERIVVHLNQVLSSFPDGEKYAVIVKESVVSIVSRGRIQTVIYTLKLEVWDDESLIQSILARAEVEVRQALMPKPKKQRKFV
ncbi:hypothetical protein KW785_02260 [Candidatus Parcubacteria bacterium]|nr:hypothetical protein [Candidatus Parcubacteria bacterium]